MPSKTEIVRFLNVLAETMEIPPHHLAVAALEYANGVLGATLDRSNTTAIQDQSLSPEDTTPDTELPAVVAPVEPYAGPFHLCLDFGTAMSKAFAWDKNSDAPVPLKIGVAAGGSSSSPYALNSVIFISHDGRAFFEQTAVNRAADVISPERHQAFQSIKDILTVGPMTDLREPVSSLYNPTEHPVSYRDVIALYLAFLIDNALLALQKDHQECSRNIPRSFTKPVFDEKRDAWATKLLADCASIGQVLADRYSGQWATGISLSDLRTVIENAVNPTEHLVVESAVLSEPVAAFASRIRNIVPDQHHRHLMMVVDVGAGTTDFAMYARVGQEGEMRLYRIKNSVTTIRVGGDVIDNTLLDYLLEKADITTDHPQSGFIRADLRRDIRLLKEQLFRHGSVARQLVNDMGVEATLEEFEACSAMNGHRNQMQKKFEEVLSKIDISWLSLRDLQVFFTGGGSALPMVTRLAPNKPVMICGKLITPVGVTQPPSWLVDECEEVVDVYPQLAVSIGGACHGADKTHLGVESEIEAFGGDLRDATWIPGGFRGGQ